MPIDPSLSPLYHATDIDVSVEKWLREFESYSPEVQLKIIVHCPDEREKLVKYLEMQIASYMVKKRITLQEVERLRKSPSSEDQETAELFYGLVTHRLENALVPVRNFIDWVKTTNWEIE